MTFQKAKCVCMCVSVCVMWGVCWIAREKMVHKLGTAREKAKSSEVPLDSSISRKGSGACYPSDLVGWADN